MQAPKKISHRNPSEPVAIPEFTRVLVTTDFSEFGNAAIPNACALLPAGGQLLLLHVIEPFQLPGPLVPHYERKRPTKKDHIKHAHECAAQLVALIPAEAASQGIQVRVEVMDDRQPGRAICAAAAKFKANVICIASHGRTGLLRAVLGSVAGDVLARSTHPVLVVRPRK